MTYIIMEWDDEGGAHYNGTDKPDQGGRNAYIIMRKIMYIIMEQDDEGGAHYNGTDEPDQGERNAIHYNVMGRGAESALLCDGGIHYNVP